MKQSEVYVIIPVYNESKRLKTCLEKALSIWPRIIVVNDGSTDRTKDILSVYPQICLIDLPINQGKGAAMRIGAKMAWKKGAKAIIFMDGDNQHNPKHILEFVRALNNHGIVLGIRDLKTDIPNYRRWGNKTMTFAMKRLFGIEIPDMMCGYRAFSKENWRKINYQTNRYGVEVEMLTIIGRKKLPYKTLIVDTIYHDRYKGFSIIDGIKIVLSLPYYRWRAHAKR